MIKVSANQALKIRDFNDSVIKDSPLKLDALNVDEQLDHTPKQRMQRHILDI
jgi:hypothetical protein